MALLLRMFGKIQITLTTIIMKNVRFKQTHTTIKLSNKCSLKKTIDQEFTSSLQADYKFCLLSTIHCL